MSDDTYIPEFEEQMAEANKQIAELYNVIGKFQIKIEEALEALEEDCGSLEIAPMKRGVEILKDLICE